MTPRNIQTTLLQADHLLEAVVFSRRFRFWAILISTAAFLSALCAYYFTFYLTLPRLSPYNADSITPALFYRDLIAGADLSHWTGGGVPYIFPDVLLFFLSRWLVPNLHLSLIFYGTVQMLLFVTGMVLLVKQAAGSMWLEHYILLMLAGVLFLSGLDRFHPYIQLFSITLFHFSVLIMLLFALALALSLLKPDRSQRKLKIAALFVSLWLLSASDLWGIVQVAVPLTGAICLLWLSKRIKFQAAFTIIIPVTLAALAGYLTLKSIPVFARVFEDYTAEFQNTPRESLLALLGNIRDIAQQYPAHIILIGLFGLACIAIVIKAARPKTRQQTTAPSAAFFFAVVYLISFLAIPAAAIITRTFQAEPSLRYMLPLLILPVFWGWPLLLPALLPIKITRAISILGLGVLIILGSIHGLTIIQRSALVRLDDYYPDSFRCIDDNAARLSLHAGLSGYWQAKPIMLLSRIDLQVVQVRSDLTPYLWVTNADWYNIDPEFVMVDTHTRDIDEDNVIKKYGEPATIFQCENLKVLVYNRSTDLLFQQQFRNRADLK